jgi:hypothetical protein
MNGSLHGKHVGPRRILDCDRTAGMGDKKNKKDWSPLDSNEQPFQILKRGD